MSVVGSIVIFVIIWIVVLFTVLPWGVKTQAESGEAIEPGTVESAPVHAHIWKKFAVTTLIAAVIFAVIWFVIDLELFDFRAFFENY
ncbi:MAG: DUF1467 family protein [Sneathiella sp.]|nr:DUF1467 family protein [Sneathiella sp.]